MKKSNRVFIALIATLYIVPALTFGVAQFTSEKCLTGFTQKFQIIQIDNPELKAENIKVDTRTASKFPRGQILEAKALWQPFLYPFLGVSGHNNYRSGGKSSIYPTSLLLSS